MKNFKRLAFKVVGIILLAAAVVASANDYEFIRHAKVAAGTVVALNFGGSHPEIQFTDSVGKTKEYAQGGFVFGYHIGQSVKVLYPVNEKWYGPCVDSPGALWFSPILLLILAGMTLVYRF